MFAIHSQVLSARTFIFCSPARAGMAGRYSRWVVTGMCSDRNVGDWALRFVIFGCDWDGVGVWIGLIGGLTG